jgi:hypothetical protein
MANGDSRDFALTVMQLSNDFVYRRLSTLFQNIEDILPSFLHGPYLSRNISRLYLQKVYHCSNGTVNSLLEEPLALYIYLPSHLSCSNGLISEQHVVDGLRMAC